MTNFEIKTRLDDLQKEFTRTLNDTNNVFEYNPRIQELRKEMDECAAQCSHLDESGEFALDENGACIYCGMRIENE